MPVVTFLPSYRKVEVPPGTTILDAARRAGLQMNVVCGGVGKCGKCIVYVKAGKAEFDRQKNGRFFTPSELGRGACLACTTGVVSDLDVTVPEGSLIQEQKILIEGLDLTTAFRPSVLKYHVTLSAPTLEDPSPDLNRILDAIHRQHGPQPE
ncbi:MAG: 2Fe-2S iron-sulfur cluster-binding protein, partial [Methanospirillum sp.]